MPRPNILVFITDQQRADALGCAGNPVVQTPNIDALAARGTRFARAYVANPLCQPARATLLTGLTPRGHRVRTNGIPLDPTIPTFVDALRRSGYRTHAAGKLHYRNYEALPEQTACLDHLLESRAMWMSERIGALPPNYEGFETADFTGGHGFGTYGHYRQWLREQNPDGERLLTMAAGEQPASGAEQTWKMALPAELHYNRWVADRSIAFLARQRQIDPDRPFVLWCSFPDPHHPFAAPKPWSDMYDDADIPLPNRRAGELDDLPPFYREMYETGRPTSGRANATKLRDDQYRDIVRQTCGMVSMVDDEVGRVMAVIDRLCLRDDTLVIFMSDHGEMLGDHWMLNKGPFHFDGLLNIPFIWSWPGHVREGVMTDTLASHLDLAPTLLDIAGVPLPETPMGEIPDPPEAPSQLPPWPGFSLRPVLSGEQHAVRDRLLVENDEDYLGLRLRTLITGRYQLTAYPGQRDGELFDRETDPRQQHNRWCDRDYAEIKQTLLGELLNEIVRTDPTMPRRSTHA
jgi:arylsulfatase